MIWDMVMISYGSFLFTVVSTCIYCLICPSWRDDLETKLTSSRTLTIWKYQWYYPCWYSEPTTFWLWWLQPSLHLSVSHYPGSTFVSKASKNSVLERARQKRVLLHLHWWCLERNPSQPMRQSRAGHTTSAHRYSFHIEPRLKDRGTS